MEHSQAGLRPKALINALARRFGYEFRRVPPAQPQPEPRTSWRGALNHIKQLGWSPRTVIDVGAAYGHFAVQCHDAFPQARYLLLEPLHEYEAALNEAVRKLPNAAYELVAVGDHNGTAALNVHVDWVGSSLYREAEGAQVDGVMRSVPMKTLDTLLRERTLQGPFLLKADVQGAELDVIAGATELLPHTEYILLETSLFGFFIGGPQVYDIIAAMWQRSFVIYDILDPAYRLLDAALAQVDLAFVKEAGVFRQAHAYASPEQRLAQNQMFERKRRAASESKT